MRVASVLAAALAVLAQADIISAKAVAHLPNAMRRRGHHSSSVEGMMQRDVDRILRRDSSSDTLGSVSQPESTTNQTVAAACTAVLATMTSVENAAGLAACYNILQYEPKQGVFEADLRLYQMFAPTGPFEGLTAGDIQIGLVYPTSTTFQALTKRKMKRQIEGRQTTGATNVSEIQQYSLFGTFESNLELDKLNDTQVMSLMLPAITLNAVDASSQSLISADLTAADGAWFVVGPFQDDFKAALVTPAVATAAIAAAAPYVIPGRTFGIFPVGFIVTGSWTVLFFLAFGLGTLGRIRYRDAYRKRKAAQAGRTGKRI
jgi:hypothetical protein